jgi:hypothetical protein
MVLDLGGQSLFGNTVYLGGIEKEEEVTLSRENGLDVIYPEGKTVDTSLSTLEIYANTSRLGEDTKSWKITMSIFNMTGATDRYHYGITNATKGTTLCSLRWVELDNAQFFNETFFYTLDQITEGDTIRLTIDDGIVGTQAGKFFCGTVSFRVHSVDKSVFT